MIVMYPPRRNHGQQGVVSLLILLVLMLGVMWVQTQSLQMSSGNSLSAQQHQDHVAALYLAESGMERARGSLTLVSVTDPANFQSTCDAYRTTGAIALGGGYFQFFDPSVASTPTFCPLKVMGVVGATRRVLQTSLSFTPSSGGAGFGSNIVFDIENTGNVGSVGVFNLAWRRHGSTGHSTSGGNANATACTLPECVALWNIESSSGSPSVGSLGTAVNLAAYTNAQITQSLSADRNYVGAGILLPGLTALPVIKGSFADDKRTANTKNNTVTTGDTSSGESNNWCRAADTLVFGLSGRGNDDVTANYTAMVFNSAGSPSQPINMTRVVHAPNTDGSTPDALGDVFSEIWTTHNPYVYATGASSSGTTVSVASPISVKAGTVLKVYSGTGRFAGNTRVVNTVVNATQFMVDRTPSKALANATVCGGICALFNNPASTSSSTQFSLTRSSSAAKEWAGGFTCLAGVDPTRINAVTRNGVRLMSWREAVTHE